MIPSKTNATPSSPARGHATTTTQVNAEEEELLLEKIKELEAENKKLKAENKKFEAETKKLEAENKKLLARRLELEAEERARDAAKRKIFQYRELL